jgi:hypothetical protein
LAGEVEAGCHAARSQTGARRGKKSAAVVLGMRVTLCRHGYFAERCFFDHT